MTAAVTLIKLSPAIDAWYCSGLRGRTGLTSVYPLIWRTRQFRYRPFDTWDCPCSTEGSQFEAMVENLPSAGLL